MLALFPYRAVMKLQPWETLSNERLVQYKFFDVRKIRRRSPRNGTEIGFFLVDTMDWVNVVGFTAERELIMIRQYRHGTETFTLEVPGGAVEPGEDAKVAALRELREESGYAASEAIALGDINPNPALFTNRCSMFLAVDCVPDGDLIQDAGEDIEVVLVPWDEVEGLVMKGGVDHALAVTALYFYRLYTEGKLPAGAPGSEE